MTANELRKKYIEFFKQKGHKEIPSSSLVPENDPTTLFTSSGMQPLIPYLLGQTHPEGKRLVDIQPCLRVGDIDEIGDSRHTTFFEMLGNWSLGNYFKKEQLTWFWEFLTKAIKLNPAKLYVTVFEGNNQIPKDTESEDIWKSLEIPSNHIYSYGIEKNWWSRSGTPDQMPTGEIGGPDSEVFYEFTQIEHDKKFGEKCHPNCNCGRFLEIGNSVFMEYQKQADGTFKKLPQKNVDFGGGLERQTAATQNEPDMFKIELFWPIIEELQKDSTGIKYGSDEKFTRDLRIITDHLRASVFLIKNGVIPSNKLQGYVLRRLLRTAAAKMVSTPTSFPQRLSIISKKVIDVYKDTNYFSEKDKDIIASVIEEELNRFARTLDRGLKEFQKLPSITGKVAFNLFQTYGFPWELTAEIAAEKGVQVNRQEFEKEFEKHKELSRIASSGMFKGGLADHSEQVTKYHTATHLLLAALREILGTQTEQKGANLTSERLRFDFSSPQKLTAEQITQVEELVNQKIKESLPVTKETMSKKEAFATGATGTFIEKYGDMVGVYTIGDPSTHSVRSGSPFSREICGGPHVKNTQELGNFKITKEESVSAGVRRIYATLS